MSKLYQPVARTSRLVTVWLIKVAVCNNSAGLVETKLWRCDKDGRKSFAVESIAMIPKDSAKLVYCFIVLNRDSVRFQVGA